LRKIIAGYYDEKVLMKMVARCSWATWYITKTTAKCSLRAFLLQKRRATQYEHIVI